jgi:hypothetical protein
MLLKNISKFIQTQFHLFNYNYHCYLLIFVISARKQPLTISVDSYLLAPSIIRHHHNQVMRYLSPVLKEIAKTLIITVVVRWQTIIIWTFFLTIPLRDAQPGVARSIRSRGNISRIRTSRLTGMCHKYSLVCRGLTLLANRFIIVRSQKAHARASTASRRIAV